MLVVGNTVPSGHTAGRIFNTEGISPTVMYRNSKVIQILEKSHKPILVGGIGEKNFGKQYRQGNRIYDSNAIAMCLHSQPVGNTGGYSYLYTVSNEIIKIDIPQQVKVRSYEVDIEGLKILLRENKKQSKLSNKQIAEKLNKPITLVEHWFRTDNCFSIPDEDVWYQLKELLNITTNDFDKSIMTFEVRDGVFEKSNRCYFEEGIAPTITSASADEKIIVGAAMRGRYNKDGKIAQQLELRDDEISYTRQRRTINC